MVKVRGQDRLRVGATYFRKWVALGVGVAALVVYVLTLAPDLTWANASADGGELITASVTLGIPHPPGYPTYVLLGKLFSAIPLGSVAYRYNLLSAVCVTGAVVLLAATLLGSPGSLASRRLPLGLWPEGAGGTPAIRLSPVTAIAAALTFAFTPLVWSQAVVAEVYGLNLLLVAAFLLTWSRRGPSCLVGLWLGLAVTAHLTSLLLLPMALWGAMSDERRTTSDERRATSGVREGPARPALRRVAVLAAGLAVGLLPLLALPRLAGGDSPVVWGRPDNVAGWWWLVSGRLYAANLRWPSLAGVLGLPPMLAVLKEKSSADFSAPRRGTGFLSCVSPERTALWATVALYTSFVLSYRTPDATVLLLPVLLLLALLLGPRLERLGPWALALPLVLLVSGFGAQDRSGDPGPRVAAEAALHAAPPDAVLLAPGDRTIFTLWYFQHVEGLRPDVRLTDANLFAFDWYRARLAALYPDLRVPPGDDLAAFQRLNGARSFCAVGLLAPPEPPPGVTAALAGGSPHLLCYDPS